MASRTNADSAEAAAFEREYPGSSYLAARAMRGVEVLGARIEALIAGVARQFGVSHAALNALAVIEGAGGPVPAGHVSAAMHITTGTVTSLLDTLERNGYVTRLADPEDRRRVLVEITPAASDLLDEMLPRVQQTVTAAMAGVAEADARALLRILDAVREGVENVPSDLPPAPKRHKPAQLRRRNGD